MSCYTTYLKTAIGMLGIQGTAEGVTAVTFVASGGAPSAVLPPHVQQCRDQLAEYFSGCRTTFTVRLASQGTVFQRQVWDWLAVIPFGQTVTYRQLAAAMGKPQAVRAVGRANATNRVNIILPCHRVVGSDGGLTGYSGGLWRKEWLLRHEGQYSGTNDKYVQN
jgi:methylated-DNA-[protein]-cysteine S-methyltransferase